MGYAIFTGGSDAEKARETIAEPGDTRVDRTETREGGDAF